MTLWYILLHSGQFAAHTNLCLLPEMNIIPPRQPRLHYKIMTKAPWFLITISKSFNKKGQTSALGPEASQESPIIKRREENHPLSMKFIQAVHKLSRINGIYEATITIKNHLQSHHNFPKSNRIGCHNCWGYKKCAKLGPISQFLVTMQ